MEGIEDSAAALIDEMTCCHCVSICLMDLF